MATTVQAILENELLHDRLVSHGPLPNSACVALRQIPITVRRMEMGDYLVREADAPTKCAILTTGFAYRQKIIGRGARQIVALCIPGEVVDLQNLYLDVADHSVQMLTNGDVATFPRQALQLAAEAEPAILRAILLDVLINASLLRDWVTNIGQRSGKARIAHLLCEFAVRLSAVSPIGTTEYELPMNQEHLADALGLTSVHLNRMLRELKVEGLVKWTRRSVRILNLNGLMEVGDFGTRYLHLAQGGK